MDSLPVQDVSVNNAAPSHEDEKATDLDGRGDAWLPGCDARTKADFDSCKERPFPLSIIAAGIPAELKALRQWVCWKLVSRDSKWTKVPIDPKNGRHARADNPSTWTTFDEALAHYLNPANDVQGVGFEFTAEADFCGVDLDDAIDTATNRLRPWAATIVDEFESYAEISPSRTGVKLYLRATKPGDKCRKPYHDGEVELYDRGRFFAMTGARWPGTPATVEPRQEQLDKLYHQLFDGEANEEKQPCELTNGHLVSPSSSQGNRLENQPDHASDLTDDEIITKASRAKNAAKFNALMEGETGLHEGDDSKADLALLSILAFYTRDHSQLERLFCRSALASRTKWTERPDYRASTLARALELVTESYKPRRRKAEHATNGVATAKVQADDNDPVNLTDKGNGMRLVEMHGLNLRHCWPWNKWLTWADGRWATDDTGAIARCAKRTIAELFAWATRQMEAISKQLEELGDE